MEAQPSFNLDHEVLAWRQELERHPTFAGADSVELEAHLRDSVHDLNQHGLSLEEAFLVARHRIGQPQQLATEYEKAQPTRLWLDRALWMLIGTVLLGLIFSLARGISITAALLVTLLTQDSLPMPLIGVVSSLVQLLVAVGLGIQIWRWVRQPRTAKFNPLDWCSRHPARTALAVVVMEAVLMGLAQGSTLLAMRFIPLPQLGHLWMSQTVATLVAGGLVVPILAFLLLRRRRALALS